MTTTTKAPAEEPPTTSETPRIVRMTVNGARSVIMETGQMLQLFSRVAKSAIGRPIGYWSDTRDEMFIILRSAAIPAALSVGLFVLLVATFAVALLAGLGAPNRLGYVFVPINAREIAAFMTGLSVAGIIGTSITADLGARRIRDELDALRVLGMDPVRMFVVPKVIATAVITAMMNVIGLFVGLIVSLLAAMELQNVSAGAYLDSMKASINAPEIWGTEIKTFLIGMAVAIICSHKGLHAKGGPEGLGRAVNQAVVISFIAVMAINVAFNATIQGLFPEMNVAK